MFLNPHHVPPLLCFNVQTKMRFGVEQLLFPEGRLCKKELFYSKSRGFQTSRWTSCGKTSGHLVNGGPDTPLSWRHCNTAEKIGYLWIITMVRTWFPSKKISAMGLSKNGPSFTTQFYYSDMKLLQSLQPMAAQLSKKAVLPLANILATATSRRRKTGPWWLGAWVVVSPLVE